MMRKMVVVAVAVTVLAGSGETLADVGPGLTWHEETVTLHAPAPTFTGTPDGASRVEIDGFTSLMNPGRPMLPLRACNVLVHPGIDWATLSIELIEVRDEILTGEHVVTPAPPARCGSDAAGLLSGELVWGDGKLIAGGRDMCVYAGDQEYPGAVLELSGTSQRRLLKSARLTFCPVQFNPVARALRLVRTARVRVSYAYRPVAPCELVDHAPTAPDFSPFVNADTLAAAYQVDGEALNGGRGEIYTYVIITTDHIATNSTRLVDYIAHKTAQGFSILVKTVEDIEAEYTQATRPELFETTDERADRIKAFLKDKYLEYGIEYVLLIGNPDPDDVFLPHGETVGDVPMKFCYPDYGINTYHAPTDSFYTDLTGQWDLDGDGIYGEWDGDRGIGGVDLAGVEVIVTRIPYYDTDLTLLDAVFDKIIEYESPGGDQTWRRRCFMPNPIDGSDSYGREGNTSPVTMAEWIKDNVLVPSGFDYYRIYEHNYDYSPHNVSPPPEQIPEGLGYTCFTRFDASHYFNGVFNLASGDSADYDITVLTDDDYLTAWSRSDLDPGDFLQFKTANAEDEGWAFAPYRIVLDSASPDYFPQQFRIEMAYNAGFSDAFLVAEETDAASHAVHVGGPRWQLVYTAPETLNTVGGKQYIRLTYTGSSPQAYVQIDEFVGSTEEAASIQPYVIPEWQNGYGVVYYNTHGWAQGASEIITSAECSQLDNTRPAFVLSKACSTASPEPADNLCAQLVWEGGIGSCGATRVSYGWGDQGYQLFMPKLIAENKPFGDVICETRADMENHDWYGWAGMYFDAMRFNVYGDPTVRLITLITGDLDGDGDVDLADLAELLGAYGTCAGDPMYNPNADLDDSGCVDLADLAELLGNYGVGT